MSEQYRHIKLLRCLPILSLAILALVSTADASDSKCGDALLGKFVPVHEPFVAHAKQKPVDLYLEMKVLALEAKSRGEKTFSVAKYMQPVLNNILSDLRLRVGREKDPGHRAAFEKLRTEAFEIQRNAIPYHDLMRLTLRYVDELDQVVRKAHPDAKFSRFYENLEAHKYEKLLAKWPEVILFPSFEKLDNSYFLKSRSAPLYLLGIITEPAYTDGFLLSPKEFFLHDLGHSAFMVVTDAKVFSQDDRSQEEILRTVEANKKKVLRNLTLLKARDPDLHAAAEILIYEVSHERGYSYELSSFKPEFETSKWIGILKKKVMNHFWPEMPINETQLARLEDARAWALRVLNRMSEDEVLAAIKKLNATNKNVLITHTPPTELNHGQAQKIIVHNPTNIEVEFRTSNGIKQGLIADVALAQVDTSEPPFIDGEVQKRIETALGSGHPYTEMVQGLEIVVEPDQVNTTEIVPGQVFKMEQVLSLHLLQKQTDVTTMQGFHYSGKIKRVLLGRDGEKIAEILLESGDKKLVRLSELSLSRSKN